MGPFRPRRAGSHSSRLRAAPLVARIAPRARVAKPRAATAAIDSARYPFAATAAAPRAPGSGLRAGLRLPAPPVQKAEGARAQPASRHSMTARQAQEPMAPVAAARRLAARPAMKPKEAWPPPAVALPLTRNGPEVGTVVAAVRRVQWAAALPVPVPRKSAPALQIVGAPGARAAPAPLSWALPPVASAELPARP